MYACLARNLYLVKVTAQGTSPACTVDFFKGHLTCIRLLREDSHLRLADASYAQRAGIALNVRTLFVRGIESAPTGPDLNAIAVLLEADCAGACTAWVEAGKLFTSSWLSLLASDVEDDVRKTAVERLLDIVQPAVPTTRGRVLQGVVKMLGTRGRLAILTGACSLSQSLVASKSGADVPGGVAEAVGQASGAPVLGPVLRLSCLFVQVAAVAVQTEERDGLLEATMQRSSALAHRLLETIIKTLQLPATDCTAMYVEELSALLGNLELLLEEVRS